MITKPMPLSAWIISAATITRKALASDEPHAGQDVAHGGRQGHPEEQLAWAGTETERGADLVARDRAHAGDRVDRDREGGGVDDQRDLADLADAEPHHEDRDPGDRRDEAQEIDVGVEQRVDYRRGAHQQTQHGAGGAADQKADRDARHAGGGIARQAAVRKQLHEGAEGRGRRREQRRHAIDVTEDLPGQQESRERHAIAQQQTAQPQRRPGQRVAGRPLAVATQDPCDDLGHPVGAAQIRPALRTSAARISWTR